MLLGKEEMFLMPSLVIITCSSTAMFGGIRGLLPVAIRILSVVTTFTDPSSFVI
jgi:hypothetical protein